MVYYNYYLGKRRCRCNAPGPTWSSPSTPPKGSRSVAPSVPRNPRIHIN